MSKNVSSSWDFRKEGLEKRRKLSNDIQTKYPDRVPIVCSRNKNDCYLVPFVPIKLIAPKTSTLGELLSQIRKITYFG